ncbi:MAG: transglycosylase domain-containing protein, partial [Paracoccus sp. (in: a-proteobacteria)]|nr:transglycosylase domain-containing protein [Paracoccus sp. (in: a-proteobacteria)]
MILGLAGAAADWSRAAFGRWLDATEIPSLNIATGTEVLARDGSLLRAFQVGNGLWRLDPPAAGTDPRFIAMLIAWEDRRFADHAGVDPRAVIR